MRLQKKESSADFCCSPNRDQSAEGFYSIGTMLLLPCTPSTVQALLRARPRGDFGITLVQV